MQIPLIPIAMEQTVVDVSMLRIFAIAAKVDGIDGNFYNQKENNENN
jgi:hypothetical protein